MELGETMPGDWVGAAATIVAALVGGLLGFFIARYRQSRKAVKFVVEQGQDIAAPLRGHGGLEIKVGGASTSTLNLGGVVVRNCGNTKIDDFSFDCWLDVERKLLRASVTA